MKQRIGSPPYRMALALMFTVSLLSALLVVSAPDASAATSVSQCNSEHNIAGQAVECSYRITNTVNGTATSSRVVATHCHGAANAPQTMVCTTNTSTSTDLVTSISQCNYAGDGGGGTMRCTVEVINRITGTATPTKATVNQCNGSADGTGVLACDPYPASTTGATVTQCNDSANGGGSTATCTVDSNSTKTSLLAVLVNQCNNSENGGGSIVICRAGLSNSIRSAGNDNGPDDDDDDDGTGGGTTDGGTPVVDTTTATPDEGGGGPPPDLGITTSQVTRVPSGGASTGGGSTSGVENARLLLLGLVLVALSIPALAVGRRLSARS